MTVGSPIYDRILELMRFGRVFSSGDMSRKLRLETTRVTTYLSRLWRKGKILRTEREVPVGGRYTAYLYCINPEGEYRKAKHDFVKFVSEEERGPSRADVLLSLLRKHGPLYGRELEELISQQMGKTNLQARDFVSRSARKLMTQGKILREGLHFGSVLTPFRHGFIYAAIDQPGEEGVKRTVEAIRARITDRQLGKNSLAAYNVVTKRSMTGRLIGFQDLASELNLSVSTAKYVLNRILRIYPELKAVEIGPYKFVYNESVADPVKIQESKANLEKWYSTEGLRLWSLGEKFEKYASMAIEEAFKTWRSNAENGLGDAAT
jgi:predicted transcriptional regulator